MGESQVETDPHGATMASGGDSGGGLADRLLFVEPELYGERVLLSEGGMGRITVAVDQRLGRKVALKELRKASPALEARFRREAFLTARLEHPGIVSVHEAGRWPSGEPFYAMRLVPGRSLDQALRTATELADRLALVPRVLAVADAVAYAHGQRVIHRDLKPHNVMLGEFGETVVIDWGLGKDLDDGRADSLPEGPAVPGETAYGSVLGTPAYMPPEQARGEPVDERADVYAIGAMLHHVLCGEPPYQARTTEAVLAAVLAGPPAPLALRAPRLPADLVAIVERAMARDPADRYPTAAPLAEDLRRFHTGQLVAAHRYSTRERIWRWARRHRGAVAVGVIAAVVLAAASGYSLDRVLAERRIAQENRAHAEELVGFMLEDLYEQLQKVERLDLLEPVARKVIAHYQRAGEHGSRAAKARTVLGDVHYGKGDRDAALGEYRAALGILEAIDTDDTKVRHDIGVLHNRIADMLVDRDPDGALAEYRRGLAVAEALAAEQPDDRQWQLDVGFSRRRIGSVLEVKGDRAGALAEYRAAQEIARRLADAAPDDVKARQAVMVSHNLIGDVHMSGGEFSAAIEQFTASRRIAEELFALDPTGARERDIAVALHKLGTTRSIAKDGDGGLADYQAMLAITERLVARDPANTMWRRDLALARSMIGDALRNGGDPEAALVYYRASLEARESLVAIDPGNPLWQGDVAMMHERIGGLDQKAKRYDDAVAHFRTAHAMRVAVSNANPENTEARRNVAITHFNLSKALAGKRELPAAIAEARAAAAIYDGLVAIDPDNGIWINGQAFAHNQVALLLDQSGDLPGALAEVRLEVDASRRVAAKDPSSAVWQESLAEALENLADVLGRSADPAGAKAAADEAAAIRKALPREPSGER